MGLDYFFVFEHYIGSSPFGLVSSLAATLGIAIFFGGNDEAGALLQRKWGRGGELWNYLKLL